MPYDKYDINEVASSLKDTYSKWAAANAVIVHQDSLDMSDEETEDEWETSEQDTSISCRASLEDAKAYFTQNYPGQLPDLYYINAIELADFTEGGKFSGSAPDTSSNNPAYSTDSHMDPDDLPTSAMLDSPENITGSEESQARMMYEQFDEKRFDRRFFCIVEVILNMEPVMETVGSGYGGMGSFESGMLLGIVNLYDSEENKLLCRKVIVAESSETISYSHSQYSDGKSSGQSELNRDYRNNCEKEIRKAIEGFQDLLR